MYPHRIRLRGPWEWEAGARGRVTMPCRWSDLGQGNSAGRVRFERRFGLPRQVDPHERVWLTFQGAECVTDVRLNDHHLAPEGQTGGTFECNVTELLAARNHLRVEAETAAGDGQPWDEVALEIRCTAYLRGVRVWAERREGLTYLHAAGDVIGNAEQPLEVYLLHANRTVGYRTVTGEQSFDVVSDPLSGPMGEVRVELVCGAVVWYTVEVSSLQV